LNDLLRISVKFQHWQVLVAVDSVHVISYPGGPSLDVIWRSTLLDEKEGLSSISTGSYIRVQGGLIPSQAGEGSVEGNHGLVDLEHKKRSRSLSFLFHFHQLIFSSASSASTQYRRFSSSLFSRFTLIIEHQQ